MLMPATVCSLLFACSPDFEDEAVRAVMHDQSDFYVFVLSDIEMEAAQVRIHKVF